jgi:hypothetical protein
MIQRDVPISIVRTVVPWLVALVGGWAAQWLGLTDDQLTTGMMILVGAAWYLLARLLEQWQPGFGWLLGAAVRPSYARDGRHEAGRDDDAGRCEP